MLRLFPDLWSLTHSLGQPQFYTQLAKQHQNELNEKYESFGQKDHLVYHRPEPWDSRLFKKRVGKIEHVTGSNLQQCRRVAAKFFSQSPYKYCVIRLSQAHISWIQAFEEQGAILLDTTVDMFLPVIGKQPNWPSTVVSAEKVKKSAVIKLAHSFAFGRFFSDPKITCGTEVYKEWIENSLVGKAADQTLVSIDENKKVHGLLTLKLDHLGPLKVLKIPLVAKHKKSQATGVAKTLLQAAIVEAHRQQCDCLVISTQGNNIAAQRAYLAAGFKPFHTGVTMRWLHP